MTVTVAPTRLARSRAVLDELGLDALFVSRGALKRWLAGFVLLRGDDTIHGLSGSLLITRDAQLILADSRYTEQAGREAAGWELVSTTRSLAPELVDLCTRFQIRSLGLEARVRSHADWEAVREALPEVALTAIDDQLTELRIVKDADEQTALARAAALTDACFSHLCAVLRIGMTEEQVAWELEDWFRHHGAEALAFDPIVLVGARAAMPHGRPSAEPLAAGRALLLDFGCQVDGYCSDMTRTVFLGAPDDETRRLYELVAGAQQAAEAAVRPGIGGTEVHGVAVDHIAAEGVPPFGHGLGHGIGLEVHEPPTLSRRGYPGQAGRTLEPGMTFTIEPGIYLPGRVGIRIEDDYLLTDAGLQRLTASPRDLMVIGA